MKITLLTVGKNGDRKIDELIRRYTDRVAHYTRFDCTAIPDPKTGKAVTPEKQKEAEGRLILNALKPTDHVVLLDERGDMPTSRQFARQIEEQMLKSTRDMVFVVGGPFGFSPEVYARANAMLALSRMTLTHEMVRLFFVEQIYRAFTIIRGESYHHD